MFDRSKLKIRSLKERPSFVNIADSHVKPGDSPKDLSSFAETILTETAQRVKEARKKDRAVILAFGAHSIKNGLAPVFNHLIEKGYVTHLATNGAGIIHDWEFAYQGTSSEDVRTNVSKGEFGIWQETGYYLNLAIIIGAYEGLGYGEAVGKFIETEKLVIPAPAVLEEEAKKYISTDPQRSAQAADLLCILRQFNIPAGEMKVPHPFKQYSVQAAAYRKKIPFTGHPMFGHDIIYTHPLNHGASIGRCAERDFLSYAQSVSNLEDGVYLSVGSAVMSPMIFEKSLSMAQNIAIQKGTLITKHFIVVVDLAEGNWDWSKGEPPKDNPAYYLRFCKTFNRMGGSMRYVTADNRDFLLGLVQNLK